MKPTLRARHECPTSYCSVRKSKAHSMGSRTALRPSSVGQFYANKDYCDCLIAYSLMLTGTPASPCCQFSRNHVSLLADWLCPSRLGKYKGIIPHGFGWSCSSCITVTLISCSTCIFTVYWICGSGISFYIPLKAIFAKYTWWAISLIFISIFRFQRHSDIPNGIWFISQFVGSSKATNCP